MTKRFPLYLLFAVLVACVTVSCNDDADDSTLSTSYSNCAVTSFSLANNDKVCTGLDSVFFSIDLVGARIFNADSLPVGTDVSKMVVKVGTGSAAACNITFPIPGTVRDTTVNIIDNPTDSINFAEGPVKMVVTSFDGLSTRTYEVRVNVHETAPDTLYWAPDAKRPLPSLLSSVKRSKTVEYKGELLCLTSDGASASIAATATPFDNNWNIVPADLPEGAVIESLGASADCLGILDGNGTLYTSTDGTAWTSTGQRMNCLYGGYKDRLLGARMDADGWKHVTYPATTETAVPKGCPVSGTSAPVTYVTKWSDSPMAIIVGGRTADGILTGESWVYDGNVWARLSTRGIDEREGVTLFPYFSVKVNTDSWRITETSALFALGGSYEDENSTVCSKTLYISADWGITWNEAATWLQLGEEFPAFTGAQAYVVDTTLPASRYSKPLTEWECPYIYLFGGTDARGNLFDCVHRGVINRFTLKPAY